MKEIDGESKNNSFLRLNLDIMTSSNFCCTQFVGLLAPSNFNLSPHWAWTSLTLNLSFIFHGMQIWIFVRNIYIMWLFGCVLIDAIGIFHLVPTYSCRIRKDGES